VTDGINRITVPCGAIDTKYFSGEGTLPRVLPDEVAARLEDVVTQVPGVTLSFLEVFKQSGETAAIKAFEGVYPRRIKFPFYRDSYTYLIDFEPPENLVRQYPEVKIVPEKLLVSFKRPAGMEHDDIEDPWTRESLAYEMLLLEVADVRMDERWNYNAYFFNGGSEIYHSTTHRITFPEVGEPGAVRIGFLARLPHLDDLSKPTPWMRNLTPVELESLTREENYREILFSPAAANYYGETSERTDLYPGAMWNGFVSFTGRFKMHMGPIVGHFVRSFCRSDTTGTIQSRLD
jgi:hypothetical protein